MSMGMAAVSRATCERCHRVLESRALHAEATRVDLVRPGGGQRTRRALLVSLGILGAGAAVLGVGGLVATPPVATPASLAPAVAPDTPPSLAPPPAPLIAAPP